MVLDGLRGYLQLASGLTDVTRERALAAAKNLVAQGEASVGAVLPDNARAQVAAVTDDLIATSRANRALLVNLVRGEVERAVARLGLVSAAELDAANRRARRLEDRVADLDRALRQAGVAGPGAGARKSAKKTAKKSAKKTTKKSTTKKTAAKKSTAKKSAARKTATEQTSGTTP